MIERLGRPTVMACTATATPKVAEEIVAAPGPADPLIACAPASTARTSSSTSLPFEGKGSKARKLAMLRRTALADAANRPAIVYCGTRKDTEEVAERAARGGPERRRLPRGHGRPTSAPRAQHRFMERRRRRRRRHQRLRDGRRQGRRALGLALGDPDERRGLLPGGRARGPRRPARARGPARVRSDLGRLVRFIQQREVEPDAVALYAQRLKALGPDG